MSIIRITISDAFKNSMLNIICFFSCFLLQKCICSNENRVYFYNIDVFRKMYIAIYLNRHIKKDIVSIAQNYA